MRIREIASSAEYRMDEQFQNFVFFFKFKDNLEMC